MLRKLYYLTSGLSGPYASRAKIDELCKTRLSRLIAHAATTVPYYHDLFDREQVSVETSPSDFDINRIPITQKRELAALEVKLRLSSKYQYKQLTSFRTGGTTGRPMEILCDPPVVDRRAASLYRAYLSNGYRFTDRIATLMYREPKENRLRKFGLLNRQSIAFDLALDEQVRLLRSIRPDVIEGYPSRLIRVAHELLRTGVNDLKPKIVFANSEKLTAGARDTIKAAFGVNPVDVYESWEFGTVAWECPRHEGLHANEDNLLVEVLNDGKPARDGEQGELIITDLYNYAMPFIRYATGDLAIISTRAYSCGRTFLVLKEVSGRRTDRLLLSDGSEMTATVQLGEIAASFTGLIEYQCVQNKRGELNVLIICNEQFTEREEANFKAKLMKAFRLERVSIEQVNHIARTADRKLRPFVSNAGERTETAD